ncbi:hypothetical protein [Streptomyces sp. NPDC056244]|uniref:hypothetical protein n=1 Tax=Streptomyces sp. NPDC056244 TaxID=3345762 RepID=UPI0035DB5B79
MDPHGPVAQRFPLIARFRPACLPLPHRVHALTELADTAATTADQGLASTVYNQAALIASDLNLPELARHMCHRHAAAYLHACPLPGMTAIRALEPVVNLARLQIRAGHPDDGRRHLLALYDAISTGSAADFEGITIPADITANAEDRREVRAWLWRVLLADGTRALTTAGRWADALAHVEKHRGIGQRMLDGRQVAVLTALTALTAGDTPTAEDLLTHTEPGTPSENAVTSCLTVLSRQAAGQPLHNRLQDLVATYLDRADEPGMTVFNTRLGLTILDALASPEDPAAHSVVAELHRRTTEMADGYAARETFAHPLFTALATDRQAQDCRDLLHTCALGTGAFPADLHDRVKAALHISDRIIRNSVTTPAERGRKSPLAGQRGGTTWNNPDEPTTVRGR